VCAADDRHQIMLAAGRTSCGLVNRALGYEVVRKVDVKPGDATNLQITPDPSALTVTASEPGRSGRRHAPRRHADDGMAVPIGVHESSSTYRGGERRFNVTIGAKPFTLNVDF